MTSRICFTSIVLLTLTLTASLQVAADTWNTWDDAKDAVADSVYYNITTTFYCGCLYESHNDKDGSATVLNFNSCYDWRQNGYKNSACSLNWEHVVPATLTPVRKLNCWQNWKTIEECQSIKNGRKCCEKINAGARDILFDPHNLVPAVGQINKLRRDDRYAELEKGGTFGDCSIKDTNQLFEPPDCKKGDVARIWLYMRDAYRVEIKETELNMFNEWSKADPVSPWEKEREERIFDLSKKRNPYVYFMEPSESGACPWEPQEKK